MVRYLFKWSDQSEPSCVDFEDWDSVWSEAVKALGHALRDINGKMAPHGRLTLDVTDANGAPVASITVIAERYQGVWADMVRSET